MSEFILKEIGFEDIQPVWSEFLWKGRMSEIEPVSVIDHEGNYDLNIKKYPPQFWAIYHESKIVGVNSGIQTSTNFYRSRGIWVHENHRQLDLGSRLLNVVFEKTKALKCRTMWSMPRVATWGFYQKNGFMIYKETDRFEFGPHYLAFRKIT